MTSGNFYNPLAAKGDQGMSRAQAAMVAQGFTVFPGIKSSKEPYTPIGMGPSDLPTPDKVTVNFVENGQAKTCTMTEYLAKIHGTGAQNVRAGGPTKALPQAVAHDLVPQPIQPTYHEQTEQVEEFGEVEEVPAVSLSILHNGQWVELDTVEDALIGDDGNTMIVWLREGAKAWPTTGPGSYYEIKVNGIVATWVFPGNKFVKGGRTGMLLVASPA